MIDMGRIIIENENVNEKPGALFSVQNIWLDMIRLIVYFPIKKKKKKSKRYSMTFTETTDVV